MKHTFTPLTANYMNIIPNPIIICLLLLIVIFGGKARASEFDGKVKSMTVEIKKILSAIDAGKSDSLDRDVEFIGGCIHLNNNENNSEHIVVQYGGGFEKFSEAKDFYSALKKAFKTATKSQLTTFTMDVGKSKSITVSGLSPTEAEPGQNSIVSIQFMKSK